MLNVFVIKRWATLILAGFIPTISFVIGMNFYNFWIGLILLFVGIMVCMFMGSMLLKNPFTMMLEGKGLLCLNIDSTGVIKPLILKVMKPYVKGKIDNFEHVDDVYDRSTVLNLANPTKEGEIKVKGEDVEITAYDKEGNLKLSVDEFNASRFGLYHYPVLIYNGQIKSLVTKDFLSEKEKNTFAEHGILYLNRKLEELTGTLRDFGRYVVELTKPKGSIFQNKWFWIIMLVALVIMALLFAKPILSSLSGASQTLTSGFSTVNEAVIPR